MELTTSTARRVGPLLSCPPRSPASILCRRLRSLSISTSPQGWLAEKVKTSLVGKSGLAIIRRRTGNLASRRGWRILYLLPVGDSMVATLYLLGCVLVPGQTITRPQPPARGAVPARVAPAGGDWLL